MFLLINTELHGTLLSVMMKYEVRDFVKFQKNINRFLYSDSSFTALGSLSGLPATGVYADSVTGIGAGGKSGLTCVVVGILFLTAVFFAPLFKVFPSFAYAAALIYVGILLVSSFKDITYDDITEYLPCLLIIGVIIFTLNIGLGMAFAFIIYPVFKLVFRLVNEVPKEFWLFTALSVVYFIIK